MKNFKKFMNYMDNGDLLSAAWVVCESCDQDTRIAAALDFLKSSPLSCHRLAIEALEDTIRNHRTLPLSDLEFKLKLSDYASTPPNFSESYHFNGICSHILKDLIETSPRLTVHAIIAINDAWRLPENEQNIKITEVLMRLASITWPEKSLLGAIYG